MIDRVVPMLVEQVLRRVDLTDVVRRHVDLNRLVATVDVDAVAARLDVDTVAARLDLAALVSEALEQVDLVAIAEQVVEAVDLPQVIRDSSGAMTSDTVQAARIRSAAADQALARARDRLLPERSRSRRLIDPGVPGVPNARVAPGSPVLRDPDPPVVTEHP